MLNTLFIVWRESLEAMLVIGILMAWIARQPQAARLQRGIWMGVLAGVLMACALGAATYAVQTQFADQSLEVFRVGMLLVAAALIVQMVFWMRKHGRTMKRELESQVSKAQGRLGIATITALAIAREGAETVVFLYGNGMGAQGVAWVGFVAAAMAGLVLALATSWLLTRGARFFNHATVFRISEALLLIIAGALLTGAVDRLIGLDWLPTLMDPVWDTSAWLDDGQGVGNVMASFMGYRARPAGVLVLLLAAYWASVVWLLRPAAARKA
jgi:high-affinity iron transporter